MVVVNIVGLVEDYNEGIFSCDTDRLVDAVDGRVFSRPGR
jgi:hypothetical protein